MTQKDFQALAHGQEWVSFYESFDKLVQDNLTRSSELLRRAMALPEVADREVQQVKAEMAETLSTERERQKNLLTGLHEELAGSYRQVSMLARSVGTVVGDLDRLTQRLNEAIASFDVEPEAAAEPQPVAEATVAHTNGTGSSVSYAAPAVEAVAPEPAAVAPEAVTEPEPAAAVEEATETVAEAAAISNMEEVVAALEEQQAMLDAAEEQLDNLEESIDLTSLVETEAELVAEPEADMAEAAAVTEAPAESEAVAEKVTVEQRPRPHWLSVTRSAARQ